MSDYTEALDDVRASFERFVQVIESRFDDTEDDADETVTVTVELRVEDAGKLYNAVQQYGSAFMSSVARLELLDSLANALN